ncbi:MAG: hypothetical protein R3241_08710 [Rheinheimera sp.]|nr:hypothetical protein [Rheinheimera sp.]
MMNPKHTVWCLLKSRFAGFFAFLLLSACQPGTQQESALMQQAQYSAAAASQLATQRLAAAEYKAALHWFRHAATLGDSQALQHALQLQQREQGRLATALWLEQQLADGSIASAAVTPLQRAELGLWQQSADVAALGYYSAHGCALTLQPVASQQAGVTQWQRLRQQWQTDTQLTQLPVCFKPLLRVNSTDLQCTEQSSQLVQCQYQTLAELVAQGGFSQLLVIAGRGKASYNNGIVQLPDNASLALLRHEFMHVLGFIDEYPLAAVAAQQLCQPGSLYPNVLITEDITAYLKQWQLSVEQIALTKVDSCQLAQQQAYRVVATDNVMRAYELGLPPLYLQLAQQVLQQPSQLMPVQYYFAYLARQQQDWPQWQRYMQQAAAWGYVDAQQALAL